MFNVPFAALQQDHMFWIVIVGVLTVGFFITFWAVQKRRAVWKQFAREHGLRYDVDRLRPRVSGTVDGRKFSLSVSRRSSDQGLFGIREVVMRLSMESDVGCEFDVTNEGVVMTAIREVVGDDEVAHIDSDQFDHETCLHTSEPKVVADYLTKRRRAAILSLIHNCPSCDVHVTHSEIRVRQRTTVKSVNALNNRLTAIKIAADLLEQE